MKQTPIYGLPYIEGQDLVSNAPADFAAMANGFEAALNEVDRRQTPEGVKPRLAATLEALATVKGVTGQTGYVTNDPATSNNGPYYYNGAAWMPYVTHTVEALHFRSVKTSAAGAYSWDWKHKHDRSPNAVLVTQFHEAVDPSGLADRVVHPVCWSYDNVSGQVRMWRSDNNEWSGNATTSFDVIAVWL